MSNLILPSLQYDMTFFSLMSTTHMINGYPSAYKLSEKLLGNGSAGTRIDFPSHLGNFCSNTSNAFGDVYTISKNLTVLPYYLTFKPTYLLDDCIRQMAGNSVEHLKFMLGLPPARANQFPSLKFCPNCLEMNVLELGYGYWHRSHQLPSAHICTSHSELLHIYKLREDGRGKTELALPSMHKGSNVKVSTRSIPILESLSALSVKALTNPLPNEFDPNQLQFTYQHGLKQHGLITSRGKIRVDEFLNCLHKFYDPIKSISPYDKLLCSESLQNFLKLIRKPRGFHHPVTHLLLIQFLFGSWDLFFSTYQWERQFQLDLSTERKPYSASLQYKFDTNLHEIAMRYKEGESLRKLAQDYSYDIGTLMRQLEKHELTTIKRRPKKISVEVISNIFEKLNKGTALKVIALETKLSKSTIDRIVASNPSIQIAWQQTKDINNREKKRNDLVQLISNNPLVTKSQIIKIIPTSYKWLITYDTVWLHQNLKNLVPIKINRIKSIVRPRVDWLKRDLDCLKALNEIGSLELDSWERKKQQAFLRRLPTLSFKPRLSKLPKSKAWIANALERLNESIG